MSSVDSACDLPKDSLETDSYDLIKRTFGDAAVRNPSVRLGYFVQRLSSLLDAYDAAFLDYELGRNRVSSSFYSFNDVTTSIFLLANSLRNCGYRFVQYLEETISEVRKLPQTPPVLEILSLMEAMDGQIVRISNYDKLPRITLRMVINALILRFSREIARSITPDKNETTRNDVPTRAELQRGIGVLSAHGNQNLKRSSAAKLLRGDGLKMSNKKISYVFNAWQDSIRRKTI